MSLITYNNELRIVLCDPKRDLLILHDSSINDFQLIQFSSEDNKFNNTQLIADINSYSKNAFERDSTRMNLVCPNCGFRIDIHNSNRENSHQEHSRSNNIPNIHFSQYSKNEGQKKRFENEDFNHSPSFDESSMNQAHRSDSNLHFPALPNYSVQQIYDTARGFSDHIDNKYFKLLSVAAQLNTLRDDENSVEVESAYETLPNDLFTQGYFNKFFKTIKLIGRGSNASVYKVEHFIRDFSLGFFALKKIPIGNDSKGLNKILKEVELLCILSSKNNNLVKYNHVWLEISSVGDFGPEIPCAFILTEYCDGGNLEELLNEMSTRNIDNVKFKIAQRRKKRASTSSSFQNTGRENTKKMLSLLEILKFFKDITSGVFALHTNHIIHRDLKPSNCLLSTKYTNQISSGEQCNYQCNIELLNSLPTVLISDFGESQFEGLSRNSTGATGTLEFVAPELLQFKQTSLIDEPVLNDFTKYTDMFGLGMILFFLCFGKLPYENSDSIDDNDYSNLKKQISDFNIKDYLSSASFKKNIKRNDLPEEIYSILKNLLGVVPEERILTDELLSKLEKLMSTALHGNISDEQQKLLDKQNQSEVVDYDSDLDLDEKMITRMLNNTLSNNSETSLIPFKPSRYYSSYAVLQNLSLNLILLRNNIYQFITIKSVIVAIQYKLIELFLSYYYNQNFVIKENYVPMILWDYKLLLINFFLLGVSVPIPSTRSQICLILVILFIDTISIIYKYYLWT